MIYAVVKNAIVENIIEAEESLPFDVIFPEADDVVLFTPDTGIPHIGLGYKNQKFQPFTSWSFDSKTAEWVAPVAKPDGNFQWDDFNRQWVAVAT